MLGQERAHGCILEKEKKGNGHRQTRLGGNKKRGGGYDRSQGKRKTRTGKCIGGWQWSPEKKGGKSESHWRKKKKRKKSALFGKREKGKGKGGGGRGKRLKKTGKEERRGQTDTPKNQFEGKKGDIAFLGGKTDKDPLGGRGGFAELLGE